MKTFRIIQKGQTKDALASGSTVVRNSSPYILTVTEDGKSLASKESAAVSSIDKKMQGLINEGKLIIVGEPEKKSKAAPKKVEAEPAIEEALPEVPNDDPAPAEEVVVAKNVDPDEASL